LIRVKFKDRPEEIFNTNSYNAAGGCIAIIEQLRDPQVTRTTIIPANLIDRVIVEQPQ